MNEIVDPQAVEAGAARPAARRRWLRPGRIALVVGLAVAAVLAWQHFENLAPSTPDATRSPSSGPPPQTVRVGEVATGDMPITLDALGTVTPFVTVTVRTQIAGRLQAVGFEEGRMVEAGAFLAQIDPRPYQAALDQAKGQLAKDEALLQQAENDLARYQTLNKQDSIARQQVDAQASLVAQDKAAILADKAQVDAAELNVGYTRIVSPIAGRVGLRLVDPGNYLQPSDASGIVVVTEIDPISVVFSTPEDNVARIGARLASGAKLPVTVFDRANVHEIATGELSTLDNQIDATTGTIRMRARFANPQDALFPNQFVNVRLLVDTLGGVALAPNAAIQIGANGAYVYALNADMTVSRRDVTTGPGDGRRTVVRSGLKAGEQVVIDGVDRLRDGAKVKLAEASPAAGAPAAAGAGDAPVGARKHKGQVGGGASPRSDAAPSPAGPAAADGGPTPNAPASPAPQASSSASGTAQ